MTITIHDLIDLYVKRIAMLVAFRRNVSALVLPVGDDVAEAVRENLLFVLGEMLFDESQSLKAERRYLRKTTEKQRARDLATEPDFYVDTFAEDWDGTKLLDNVLIDADAGKMRDLIRREVHPITGTFPLRIAVTNERLGTLAPIIRQMESEFEISFVIERIFCNEEQLIAFAAADL